MGKINELLCDYLGRPEYYADFWNGTKFQGKRCIQWRYLTRYDREYHKSQHKPVSTVGIRRDVLMKYHDISDFVLGVEVMENPDYTMPIRIMDYDAQELQRQVKDIRFAHEQAVKNGQEMWESVGEYLYGVTKEDEILPVHTIALYCGTKDYDGKESILGMTNYQKLAPYFQELFADYPIKVYQLKDLWEENYQTSLREIIAVFKRCQDRNAVKKYYLEHKERFRQLDELAIDTMGALIGNSKLRMFQQEDGGVDMCKAFEDEREEGREEGLRQAINNLMENLKWTFQQAVEAIGIPQNEWEKYRQV